MKWSYIRDKQPKDGELIIQIDRPFGGNYPIGMRKYDQNLPFEDYLLFCKNYNLNLPDFWWISSCDFPSDFWWISSCDFPFPDQPERSKREDCKSDCRCGALNSSES